MPLGFNSKSKAEPDPALEALMANQNNQAPTVLSRINYEPLKQLDSANSRALKIVFRGWSLVLFIVVVAIAIALSALAQSGWPIFFAAIAYAARVSSLINKFKTSAWENFGVANGWSIDAQTSEITLAPASINYGNSPVFSPVLQANLEGHPADLYTYQCTTGSGKYSQVHYFTVVLTSVGRYLPHIMLLSKSSHNDAHEDIENHTSLQLEGDFGKYFKLIVQSGQEIDALQVLTPDVMQTLINYNKSEDIEISDNNLYFISRNDKRDYKDMPVLIASAVELQRQIAQNVDLASVPLIVQPQQQTQGNNLTAQQI